MLAAAGVSALDALELALGPAAGAGWRIASATARLDLAGPDAGISLSVKGVELPGLLQGPLSLEARCAEAPVRPGRFECVDGSLAARGPGGGLAAEGPMTLVLDQGLALDLGPLRLGEGTLTARVELGAGAWRADVALVGAPAAALGPLLAAGGVEAAAGIVDGVVRLAGRDEGVEVDVDLRAAELAFSDAPGLRAGEGLAARLAARGLATPDRWRGELSFGLEAGALFLSPVFLDVGVHRLTGRLAGSWSRLEDDLRLERLELAQEGVGSVSGRLGVSLDGGLRSATLELPELDLGAAFALYGAPALAGSPAGDLTLAGSASGSLEWSESGRRALDLELGGLEAELAAAGLAVFGVDGRISWEEAHTARPSTLAWAGAQIYGVDLGSGTLRAELAGARLDLLEPVSIPVLDGRVVLTALSASAPWAERPRVELAASLEALSLGLLANTFAWPPFEGTIGGRIPAARYEGDVLEVGGAIEVDAFEGRIALDGLRIERPLGPTPVLETDAVLEGLSLGALTRAFAFGNIEGTIAGRVQGLRLEDWTPTAFDAVLATPRDDPVPHRISQRAVDNLASLGGSGAVLSGTFLRIFREFSYDRLGLSCRLERGVCHMGGVAPAQRGYHIVIGGGIPPRIDVIGYNEVVDWTTLLERLRTITGRAPVMR